MSRRALVLGMLALSGAAGLQAQSLAGIPDAELRLRLARADSLLVVLRREADSSQAAAATSRRAYLVQHGQVAAAFWDVVPRAQSDRIVRQIDSLLGDFGAVPASFLNGTVGVQMWASDTAGLPVAMRARRHLILDWANMDDTTEVAARVAGAWTSGYRRTLDSTWRAWLPEDYGLVWRRKMEGEWAMRLLAAPGSWAGEECLAGRLDGCRRWLGLDSTDHALASRYSAAELRMTVERSYMPRVDPDRQSCIGGLEAACVRYVRRYDMLHLIPASALGRASVVRALHAIHGREAVARALADTQGPVLDRMVRAAGVPADSFLVEWRAWTLSKGHPERVRAGLGDAVVVFLAAGLLVLAATRSGRWT